MADSVLKVETKGNLPQTVTVSSLAVMSCFQAIWPMHIVSADF